MIRSAPQRIRFTFFKSNASGAALPLPKKRMWPAGLIIGAMFVIFSAIEVSQIISLYRTNVKTVFDLSTFLFQGFWILGWSVGVLILGMATFLFLLYAESARLEQNYLILTTHLGCLKIRSEYLLSRIGNVRMEEPAKSSGDKAQIKFDYDGTSNKLGEEMPRSQAESIAAMIRAVLENQTDREIRGSEKTPECIELHFGKWIWKVNKPQQISSAAVKAAPEKPVIPKTTTAPSSSRRLSPSALILIGANLTPLAGVLLLDWNLGELMVLFWCENAVIGFYNILKLIVVGKLAAFFTVPFFIGHFGAFMAGHFLFVYYFFVRSLFDNIPDLHFKEALTHVFLPLWPAILALFISHGISFWVNFLGRKEYIDRKGGDQMNEPYKRVFILHLTILFGGFLVMLLKNRLPGLLVLLGLKIFVDLQAHKKEHSCGRP